MTLQKYLQHTIKGKIKVDCLIAGALHSLQRYLHPNDGSVCCEGLTAFTEVNHIVRPYANSEQLAHLQLSALSPT